MPVKAEERINGWLPWLLLGFGLYIFIVINLGISGMRPMGIAVNLFGLCGLLAYLNWPCPRVLIGLFAANAVCGPFFLVNLKNIDLPFTGRLDFMVALLVGLVMTLHAGRISRPLFLTLITFFTLFIWNLLLCIKTEGNLFKFFDAWYATAGRLAVGIVMFRLIAASKKPAAYVSHFAERWAEFIVLALLLAHTALSWLQLFVPVALRLGTLESSLVFSGFTLNRPVGLFESSYVYGVTSIGLWWIWRYLSYSSYQRLSIGLLVLLLPVSLIATRSVAFGMMLFAVLALGSTLKGLMHAIFMLIIMTLLFGIPLFYQPILAALDQSNSTKVLLSAHTLIKWSEGFPSLRSFLGYGYGQATQLAASSDFFNLATLLDAAYDNRIDDDAGFLIHNVYLQLLFEYGLVAAMPVAWLIWRGMRNILLRRLDSATAFFWCVAITHYAAHNGIFSPLLTLAILLGAFPQSVVVRRHDSKIIFRKNNRYER